MIDKLNPAESQENARQQELLAPLRALRDSQSRLARAIEQARHRPPLPEALRLEKFQVPGCQIRIWFVPKFAHGICQFQIDSDAASLKALGGLLCDYYSGESPAAILRQQADFLHQLGLLRHLAENRRATVLRIADQIREFALTHQPPVS